MALFMEILIRSRWRVRHRRGDAARHEEQIGAGPRELVEGREHQPPGVALAPEGGRELDRRTQQGELLAAVCKAYAGPAPKGCNAVLSTPRLRKGAVL